MALDTAEIFISDGAKSDLGNLLDLFDVDNTVLVPDPVYPVYVDDNVMAGRRITYMPASAENHFLPMPDENTKADIVLPVQPQQPDRRDLHAQPAQGLGRLGQRARCGDPVRRGV